MYSQKQKQQNKNSWSLFSVSVTASERLCLCSPRAPQAQSLAPEAPGQTSVMTPVAICLQVSSSSHPEQLGLPSLRTWHRAWQSRRGQGAACGAEALCGCTQLQRRLRRAEPWVRPCPFIAAFHPTATQWGWEPLVNYPTSGEARNSLEMTNSL